MAESLIRFEAYNDIDTVLSSLIFVDYFSKYCTKAVLH